MPQPLPAQPALPAETYSVGGHTYLDLGEALAQASRLARTKLVKR